jgi:hypothetical protein
VTDVRSSTGSCAGSSSPGPVMAKGHEDTALYCHNALLAANEVGTDPVRPSLDHAGTAARARRAARHSPRSLNTTATHDTKRGEDTRARIAVLSEVPDEWRTRLRRWIRTGDEWKAEIAEDDDTAVPDADVDSLLYQTCSGPGRPGGADVTYTDRIKEYMTKAVREAKEQTSWRRPDEDYEQAVHTFVDRLMEEFGRAPVIEDVAAFADRLAPHGALNSLAQTAAEGHCAGRAGHIPGHRTVVATRWWIRTTAGRWITTRRQLLESLAPLRRNSRLPRRPRRPAVDTGRTAASSCSSPRSPCTALPPPDLFERVIVCRNAVAGPPQTTSSLCPRFRQRRVRSGACPAGQRACRSPECRRAGRVWARYAGCCCPPAKLAQNAPRGSMC